MTARVFVSFSGKTVELEVGAQARVDAVQQALEELTGVLKADQILMCEGARLDATKPLAAYGMHVEEAGKMHDMFLYSRAHLLAEAPLPAPETLPECPLDLSELEAVGQQRHPLDESGSPLLRLLPDYQRQFQSHLLLAAAQHQASQQRLATCARLVSEQEVQAVCIDAATSNVELHYAYIRDAFAAFHARFQQQHAAHTDVLSRFEADLQQLASTELHPALREQAGPASLADLVDAERLREAAAACVRGHHHFGGKVAELEGLFAMLKADVEALFMQAPSVDLEALTRQLEEMHGQVDEQASIVAALSSDLGKVQQLVAATAEAAAGDPAASAHVGDTVHMLETMRETHVGHLAPRVEACHAAVEAFAAHCLECKNALTRDVFTQLRTISSQQSKIREMKNKLALFREALARQDSAVAELLVVRRVPAAYKQCLAECVRRGAFMEKYAASAAALAERMGSFREKELAMRDSFRKHVERLIPVHLLEGMGLLEQPPHCQVSVSAAEGERLLAVSVDDVRRIQLPWGSASLLAPVPASSAAGGGGASREGQQASSAEQQQQQATEEAAAAAEPDALAALQLENAKLRAELAAQIALDCIRSAQVAGMGGSGSAAAQRQAGASGHVSPQLAASAASSPRAPPGVGPAGAVGHAGPGGAPGLPPEAARRFERALAAKDGLAAELQGQLSAARQQSAAYEARIQQLEVQLSALATQAAGLPAAPPAAATSAVHSRLGAPATGSATPASGAKPAVPAASSAALRGAAAASSSGSLAASAAQPPSLPVSAGEQPPLAHASSSLSSSADAAAGSSLAGSFHAPDPSRSLGASSSTQAAAQLAQPPADASEQGLAAAAAASGALRDGMEQLPQAGQPASGGEASGGSSASGSAQQEATEDGGDSADQVAAPSGSPAAPAGEEAGQEMLPAASDTAPAGAAPPAAQEGDSSAADTLPLPQLGASVVVDEGSDVEGIEPVTDDESQSAGPAGGGYESASEQPTGSPAGSPA